MYNKYITKRSYIKILLGIVFFTTIILALNYFVKTSGHVKTPSQKIPVKTVVAKLADVPIYISALGTITATNTVLIKPQVNGQLIKLHFEDGQKVKEGDILAEIDSRPYEAQLIQYQGQLERDEALLKNSLLDLKRYEDLWKQNSISKQIFDTQKALVLQYQGTVKFDKGLVEAAKTNLSYCEILSPVSGKAGIRQVDVGNIVQTSDQNSIVIVNTLSPISVIFSIPEIDLYKLQRHSNDLNYFKLEAYDKDRKKLLSIGKIIALDNEIDVSTGMIKIRGSFDNNDLSLFPNQFVNIEIQVDTIKDALIVPNASVQNGPQGKFVFVIKDDDKVQINNVTISYIDDANSVISEGLNVGDEVVIEGVDKLVSGTQVLLNKSAE